jgi:hypothetical protein
MAAVPSLNPLEVAMFQDRILREGVSSLVDKERRLAELELLLRLSDAGAPLTAASAHGHGHGHHRPPASVVTSAAKSAAASALAAASNAAFATASPAEEAASRIFDDTDPTRTDAASLAAAPTLPSLLLRPRSERADLAASEIELLSGGLAGASPSSASSASSSAAAAALLPTGPPAKSGLDLTHLALTDDSVPELTALFTALGPQASQSLRVLDVRSNEMGKAGAAAIVDAVKRFPRLEALCLEGNEWGGKTGVGALVDVATRAAVMAHLGVSLDEAPPLPFDPSVEIIPPGLPKKAPGEAKKGRSASPGKKAAPGGATKTAAGAKGGKAGAGGAAGALGPPGTVVQLSASIRANSSITSVSLAGSTLPREALLKFVSAWAPPAPLPPGLLALGAGADGHAPAAAKAPAAAGGKAPAAPAKAPAAAGAKKAPAGAGAKKGAGAGAGGHHGFTPLTSLDLSRCHIGALGALDVAVALGPVPQPGEFDPSARLGGIYPYGTNSGMGEAAAAMAAAAAAASGKAGAGGKGGGAAAAAAVLPAPAYAPGTSVHGCLQYLRVLSLSGCGLTSHGVIPVLESVAAHCSFLSHLILRDNYIDDAGAAALAAALRINAERVGTLQADARAHAVLTHPMFLLTGRVPDGVDTGLRNNAIPSLSPGSRVVHHLGVAAAAGLSAAHFTPVRVVDVRNNPLAIAGDPAAHPGCTALVDALANLPTLVSLVGPEPSVSSAVQYRATAAKPATGPDHPLPDHVLVGKGDAFPVDLAAISAAARAAMRGGATGPSSLLSMPAGLANRATQLTLRKCVRLAAEVAAAAPLGASAEAGADPSETAHGSVVWRLHSPVATQAVLGPLTGNPHTLNHTGSRVLSSLLAGPGASPAGTGDEPHEASAGAPPASLGGRLLCVGVPTGLIGHDEDTPVVRAGSAGWLLHSPRVFLEWRSSYTGSAAMVALASAQQLVFHVLVGGPGGRPLQHVASSAFAQGSRDRLHARQRLLARLGLGPPAPGDEAGTGDGLRQEGKDDGGGAGGPHAAGGLRGAGWSDSAGLDVPHALGAHNARAAAAALPPALAVQAVASAGAHVVAWPLAWHSALLPSHIVSSVADARAFVFAEVQQTSVRGVAAQAGTPASGPQSYGVYVLEAELVVVEEDDVAGAGMPPTSARAIQSDVAFTF